MQKTLADAFDDFANWIAVYLLLGALNLGMEAAAYLVEPAAAERLHAWAQFPMRIGIVVWLLAFFSFARARRRALRSGRRGLSLDGYAVESAKRAGFIAFSATLFVTVWLDVATNRTALPADFFIKLPAVCLAGVFGLSFLAFNVGAGAGDQSPAA